MATEAALQSDCPEVSPDGSFSIRRELWRRIVSVLPERLDGPASQDHQGDAYRLIENHPGPTVNVTSRAYALVRQALLEHGVDLTFRFLPLSLATHAVLPENAEVLSRSANAAEILTTWRSGQIVLPCQRDVATATFELAAAFPNSPIVIVGGAVERMRALMRKAPAALSSDIELVRSGRAEMSKRIAIATFEAARRLADGRVVIVPMFGTYLPARVARIAAFNSPTRLLLVRDGRRLDSSLEFELQHRFGHVLLDARPEPAEHTIHFLKLGGRSACRPEPGVLLDKAQFLWSRYDRNQLLVKAASRAAGVTEDQAAEQTTRPRVWLLAETTGHARILERLLPWPVQTANGDAPPPALAIVTLCALDRWRQSPPPETLVNATGGHLSGALAAYLETHATAGSAIQIVDVDDRYDAGTAWYCQCRRKHLVRIGCVESSRPV
jgi:hypothetical protein